LKELDKLYSVTTEEEPENMIKQQGAPSSFVVNDNQSRAIGSKKSREKKRRRDDNFICKIN
jgi:hypothetical protein